MLKRVFLFYYNGFRSMTWGRLLQAIRRRVRMLASRMDGRERGACFRVPYIFQVIAGFDSKLTNFVNQESLLTP